MKRNGWELADVLNRAVPGKSVVEIGDNPQVHTVFTGFRQNILHNSALALRGEKDLVHKLLACMLEQRIESADNIPGTGHDPGSRSRKFDKAFKCVAEVANAFQMVAESVCLRSGANNENVASVLSAIEPPVDEAALGKSPQAQCDSDHAQRNENN